jgi:hypothetical protein
MGFFSLAAQKKQPLVRLSVPATQTQKIAAGLFEE